MTNESLARIFLLKRQVGQRKSHVKSDVILTDSFVEMNQQYLKQ
jgi:hypothetical protein